MGKGQEMKKANLPHFFEKAGKGWRMAPVSWASLKNGMNRSGDGYRKGGI
jgi:hypothetical protein